MRSRGLSLLIFVLLSPTSWAKDVIQTEVSEAHGRYTVAFVVIVNAPMQKVRQRLTDFNHLNRLSDTITQSKVLWKKDGITRLSLNLKGCIWFFCKNIRKVEDVETLPNGDLITAVVPSDSDFAYAFEHWKIV